MRARLLPVAIVLFPALLGLVARGAEFASANGVLTASAGRVAPQEIADTLATGDLILAVGLAVSLAFSLVWIGVAARDGLRGWAPRAVVALGLLAATLSTLRLQALNRALADDYRATVVAAWAQPEGQALEQAEAFYSSTYGEERPVHASVQLSGLVAGGEGEFEGASTTRLLGLLLAVAALITALRRSPDWPERARAEA
jgi:hypothetical protein